ncbi:unnamed protein product [Phytophthora lilii]|uniref:Unnamed protein product n=1 Tax=Phytophthora lilii TaxID=2077276 RepID=A0A9W6WT82_9STRA|nr:unnamed protein product [Phytophthora lilii]
MTHLRCPRGSGAAGQPAAASNGGLEPANLFVCPRHDEEPAASPTSSADASNSLRMRLEPGDVVLILEFNNALLPPNAKTAAPDAANHWGVVTSADETEPHGHGNQLLSVRMFVDDNVLVVPNQYAVRVAKASDFSRPVDLIHHCLERHAMVELQLRQLAGDVNDAEASRILSASNAAFSARLKALNVTAAQAKSDAELGLARWRRFLALPEPRQYDGLGETAPSYLYVDTRGSRPGQQAASSSSTSEAVTADADGDVSMTDADADTDSGGAAANGSSHTSKTAPSRPSNAGKSPHESDSEKPGDEAKDVMVLDKRLSQSPVKESATQQNTQDTIAADTQDTQQDSEQQTWSQATSTDTVTSTAPKTAPATPSHMNSAISFDTNSSNKRAFDAVEEGVKRQKINTETLVGSKPLAFTPTNFSGLQPGATLSAASAPATLHISPMASSARTTLPQKRKHLTRKQKMLAEMPPLVLEQLEQEALRYLEDADGSKPKPARMPSDADKFPCAARAANFRPAFYRPTVMLGHSGLRRPGVDAVSRLLVSQDKRNIKCFVQAHDGNADVSTKCSHLEKSASPSPGFILLDLLSLRSFRDLESVVRTRLVETLGKRSRYTREYFGMDAHKAQRWLEQQNRKKTSDQLSISLSYCAADGVKRHLELNDSSTKPSPKDMQAWLCFCANVCHLSVGIAVPTLTRPTSAPLPAQPQSVVAGSK